MSDLLEAASAALGVPAPLVRRSAAARAAAAGVSADDILAAWSGGAPAPAAPAPAAAEPAEAPAPAEPAAASPVAAPEPEPVAIPDFEPAPAAVAVIEEERPQLEPVPMGKRVGTATRIGAWVGAALGVIGFLVATMTWAPAAVIPAEGAGVAVEVSPMAALIAITAVSVLFGAVVASISRAATSWRDPAMELSSRKSTTAWVGAAIGLVLGVAAGGLLTGTIATPVGEDGALVHLPVLATLIVMVIGGAVLGAVTAAVPQIVGVPVAIAEDERAETEDIRRRLGATVSVPVLGAALFLILVLPFAYLLIQSNHLTTNGAAIVAIITAAGILGYAALSGNRPNVRITFGELMVAVVGIGTVLLLIVAVLFIRNQGAHEGEEAAPETAAVVSVI